MHRGGPPGESVSARTLSLGCLAHLAYVEKFKILAVKQVIDRGYSKGQVPMTIH